MVIQPNNEDMVVKAWFYIMRISTKTTNGYYYVDVTKDEDEGKPHDNEKDIRLKWSIIKSFQQKKLKMRKKEIENFKFFVQYGDFRCLKIIKTRYFI